MREKVKKAIDEAGRHSVPLGKMQIRDDELQEIAEYIIKTQPHVKQVLLPHNPITDKGATILAKALAPLVEIEKKLDVLDLSYTQVGEKGYQALCEGLVTLNPFFGISLYACKWQDVNTAYDIQQTAIKKFHEKQANQKGESHHPSTPAAEPTSKKGPRTK